MRTPSAVTALLFAATAFPAALLAAEAPPPGEAAGPSVAGDVCADGAPHTFRLQQNRDRLLASLAAEKGVDACTLWGKLSLAERDIFEMVTAYLGSCDSRLAPPPSTSDETALDHAVKLYSINGPGLKDIDAAPVPSEGGACGGYNSNRIFVGFDSTALADMRAGHEDLGQSWGRVLNPKHNRGYNWWRATNDPGGAHIPFTDRDMICWGGLLPCWVRFANSEGPTWHFFKNDGDASGAQKALWDRRGVCGVADPDLVELTIAFNLTHESDPLCSPSWKGEVIDKIGRAYFRTYKPGGSCAAPPTTVDPSSGLDHGEAGLGPDKLAGTCLAPAGGPAASAAAAPAAADSSANLRKAGQALDDARKENLP